MRLRAIGWAAVIAAAAMTGAACDRGPATNTDARPGDEAPAALETSDETISTTIQGRYFASGEVKARDVDVTTEMGVVTLTGTVETESEKQEAVRIARDVEGVVRVDDQLMVAGGTASDERGRQAETQGDRNPVWITTKIQAQYFINPEIKPWNIDVTTANDGVVTLSGEVDAEEDRQEAIRIARATEGVTEVVDKLRIGEAAEQAAPEADAGERTEESGESMTDRVRQAGDATADAWITTKIQSKYFVDPDVKGRHINVDTSDGVVTIRGAVGSTAERRLAVAAARNTDGVREVRDELRVERGLQDDPEPERGASTAAQAIDDVWITTKLQSKYFVDDEIRPFQIGIETNDGKVTLTGTVGSSAVRQAAEELARDTEGVTGVVNRIRVDAAVGAARPTDAEPTSGPAR